MSETKIPFRWEEQNWVRGDNGKWESTTEVGGWVQIDGEWKFIPGDGEWEYNNDGKMTWVPKNIEKLKNNN